MPYLAKILRHHDVTIQLGPTDTRDEASRLVRGWLDAHAGIISRSTTGNGVVFRVDVLHVSEDEPDDDAEG